jgi:hypothetical protein
MSSKAQRNATLILFVVVLLLGVAVYFANKPPPPPNDPFWVNLDYRDLLTNPTQLIARPTQYPELPEISTSWFNDRFAMRKGALLEVLPYIYRLPLSRFIIPPPLRDLAFKQIDVLVTVPDRPREKLQAELQKQFGIKVRSVTLQTNVFLLVVKTPGVAAPSTNGSDAYPIRNYIWGMEGIIGGPVIDRTGLDGVYKFSPNLPPRDFQAARKAYRQALLDQLGLELIPTNMPVEFLILEHATNDEGK